MARQFYLDTSIWLDFYERRGENGQIAFRFLSKVIQEHAIIFYSDLIIVELKKLGYSQEQIIELFRISKPNHLKRIHIYQEHLDAAHNLMQQRGIPKGDALHAILARDYYAFFISRDKHFKKLQDIARVYLPEHFI